MLEEEQIKRKQMVRDACNLSQSDTDINTVISNKDMLDHIIVDEEHQLLYCYIPKVVYFCVGWNNMCQHFKFTMMIGCVYKLETSAHGSDG